MTDGARGTERDLLQERSRSRESESRRLDPARDTAILQATLDGLAEYGYDRLSVDQIAARAHVGKAAIYRRWRSKAEIAVAAIEWRREALEPLTAPDTGTLRGDLEALLLSIPTSGEAYRSAAGHVLDLATAATRDASLADALDRHVLARPRQVVAAVLAHAVARGEIPTDRDLSLVPDVVMGLNMVRMASGKPLDRAFMARVFAEVVLPLLSFPTGDTPPA